MLPENIPQKGLRQLSRSVHRPLQSQEILAPERRCAGEAANRTITNADEPRPSQGAQHRISAIVLHRNKFRQPWQGALTTIKKLRQNQNSISNWDSAITA